jgi:CheY-like chemotaxis protein
MSYRYLIVDVSATTRALVKRAIRESGLGVDRFFEAATADEVMDVLEQQPVDLILADPRLPDADGAELLARVMAEPDTRGIPVVVMAARMDPRKAEYLRRRGVRGVIRKPVSAATFREVVGQILEPTHV